MGELREDGIWPKDEDGGKNFAAAINDLLHIVEKYNITPEQYEMGDIFLKEIVIIELKNGRKNKKISKKTI